MTRPAYAWAFLPLVAGLLLVPGTTHAQATGASFETVVHSIISFVDFYVIPLLYALAFLFFLFGLFLYFFTGGEENRAKARPFVVWGLAGFVVLFSVWGIVNLLISAIPTG